MTPEAILVTTLAFMTVTFVLGAFVYWAVTTARRPPPEE